MERRDGRAGRAYTTREMQGYEHELIERMKQGQGTRDVLTDGTVREQTMQEHSHLSVSQRNAIETALMSRDQMMALEGVAGAGKTTSLAAVREAAERAGYDVEGLAPTSRAAHKLAGVGIETQTLQRHLARGEQPDDGRKRLYVVDESSMASTQQMHTFVERLKEHDRVLFVGDSRMAYVSVSRAQFNVKMYTNDAKTLGQELSRDVTKATALSQQELGEKVKPQSVGIELSQGLSVG